MLIVPDGMKAKQAKFKSTDIPKNKPLPKDAGYQPTREAQRVDIPKFTGWALPFSFCPDCEKTDITPRKKDAHQMWASPGLWELSEPLHQIDLRPGDIISYFICYDCENRHLWSKDLFNGQPMSEMEYNSKITERRQRNMVEWITAARLRGESPSVEER